MKTLLSLALAAALVPAVANSADAPEAVVKFRQSVMKSMAGDMTCLSLVAKKELPLRDATRPAEALRAISADLSALFPAGTGPDKVKTAALAPIWEHWSEFRDDAAKLQRECVKLEQVARGADQHAFEAQFKVVADACSTCHKPFRAHDTN